LEVSVLPIQGTESVIPLFRSQSMDIT